MEERGGMGEEEEWLEEWVEWRRSQRGGAAGVEQCLSGRTWRKVKRRRSVWRGGKVKEEERLEWGNV